VTGSSSGRGIGCGNGCGNADPSGLDTAQGGSGGGPLLVLLHGLGGNSGAWSNLLPLLAGRRWLIVDLPGHGWSPALTSYSYSCCAEMVSAALPEDGNVVVLGHSFGGAVGLALAAVRPLRRVVTVGMRASWPPEFTATLDTLAVKPVRGFGSREDAAAFLLRINGLSDFLPADSEFVERGLVHGESGWRLAQDPRSFAVGVPPFDSLFAEAVSAGAAVTVAHGERDSMVAVGDYDDFASRYGVEVVVLSGLGHNAHVESPQAVAGLLPT